MNPKFRLSEFAKSDLTRIYRYGAETFGAAQADVYYNALFDHIEYIAESPHRYLAVDEIRPSYRRSICGVESIYYRIQDSHIEIMRTLGRQDTWTHL